MTFQLTLLHVEAYRASGRGPLLGATAAGAGGAGTGPRPVVLAGVMEAQQALSLPAALIHNDADDAVDQWRCVPAEERLQHLYQGLCIQTTGTKAVQDGGSCSLCPPPLISDNLCSSQGCTASKRCCCCWNSLARTSGRRPGSGHRLWPCSPLLSWGQCSLWRRWKRHERAVRAMGEA